MSAPPEGIGRWTARCKATVVMGGLKRWTTTAEVVRTHDLSIGGVAQRMADFVSVGTGTVGAHPRDPKARPTSENQEFLAKIGALTMAKEASKTAREHWGKPLPDANP